MTISLLIDNQSKISDCQSISDIHKYITLAELCKHQKSDRLKEIRSQKKCYVPYTAISMFWKTQSEGTIIIIHLLDVLCKQVQILADQVSLAFTGLLDLACLPATTLRYIAIGILASAIDQSDLP